MEHPLVQRNLKGMISIEGSIGAGKYTVLEHLRKNYPFLSGSKLVYVPEPSDVWNADTPIPERFARLLGSKRPPVNNLALFYSDPARYAFQFQVFAFCTRTGTVMRAISDAMKHDEPFLVVTERSVLSDRDVFVDNLVREGKFPEEALAVYEMFWQMVAGPLVPYLKAFLYWTSRLRCATIDHPKGTRVREAIPIEYLQELQEAHERMFAEYSDSIPVSRVDWSVDMRSESAFPVVESVFESMVDMVLRGSRD